MPFPPTESWLSLDDAAARIGLSRLRMREAIAAGLVEARRDNQGSWRVSLGDDFPQTKARLEAARIAPGALVDLLFDEIEDAALTLAERDSTIERLNALAARQQAIIERALALSEEPASVEIGAIRERLAKLNDRSVQLIETALARLVARDGDVSKLGGLLDRALATIGGLEDEVTRQTGVVARQKGLLDRLFALANVRLDRLTGPEGRSRGLLDRLRGRLSGSREG
jgi:uncharacterized coiled-coil protein SlyX